MTGFKQVALFFCLILSDPCWGSLQEEDYPLTSTAKRLINPDAPCLVVDIDHTLCVRTPISEKNREIITEKYPEALLITYYYKQLGDDLIACERSYFFYPDYGEALLNLLNWGWRIAFFSSELKERNEILIPTYLKIVWAPYSQDIEQDYTDLTEKGALSIFSFHHMSYQKNRPQAEYERQGDWKKDLSVVGAIDNTVLADDNRTYVMGGIQYPFIGLSCSDSSEFASYLTYSPNCYSCIADKTPLNNAAYILGILAECKDLIDRKEASSLRAALDSVLRNPLFTDQNKSPFSVETPWFLYPERKNPKVIPWVERGKGLIGPMRTKANVRRTEHNKTNYKEIEVVESMFKDNPNNQSFL